VQVIAHHRKAQNIHGKDACQEFQPPANPFSAMRVIPFRLPILSAQMRPADTAVDDMENLNFPVRNDLASIHPWHTRRSKNANGRPLA
jgi:hypothetical protein